MARIQELTLGGNNRALLLIAVIAGLVAAAVVFVAVSSSSDDDSTASPASSDRVTAVVAAQGISAGTEITDEMVKVVEVPEDLLVAGTYDDTELVVGDVAKVAIAEGEQINSAKLGFLVPEGLTGVLPRGMRAVSIEVVEATAVGGLLLPGDHVDIVATYVISDAPGLPEGLDILRTETILQDVEVLSVAQESQEPVARAEPGSEADEPSSDEYISGQLPEDVEEQPGARTLTVALTSQQVQVLVQKQEHAKKVWAALRPFGERGVTDVGVSDVFIDEEDETKIVVR